MQTTSRSKPKPKPNTENQKIKNQIQKKKKKYYPRLAVSYNSHLILIRLGQSQTVDSGQWALSGFEAGASSMSHMNRWQCKKKTAWSVFMD